jgi:hypothetical protein
MIPFSRIAFAGLLAFVLSAAASRAQNSPGETPPAARYVGEIVGNDVYVRSGPSKNYYPVMKLNAGNRVTIVGQESGWLAIAPPASAFSAIDAKYVDQGDGRHGTVNASNVFVRAGSLLTKDDNWYARQLKLQKGAPVEIIGPGENGKLKIVPPEGTRLWISADFVTRVPGEVLAANPDGAAPTPASTGSEPTTIAGETTRRSELPAVVERSAASSPPADSGASIRADTRRGSGATASASSKASAKPAKPVDVKAMRSALELIDKDLNSEMAKPLVERNFAPLIERFRPYAEQTDDEFSHLYAQQRITQMEWLATTVRDMRSVQELAQGVQSDRKAFMAQRSQIKPPRTITEHGFHAEGELRTSAVYDVPNGPKRYRLVDPAGTVPRTLCYLEFPPECPLNPQDFIGRKVGVRASGRRTQSGDVDPISIFFVSDLVLLDQITSAAPGN